jgi:hypothetical protein
MDKVKQMKKTIPSLLVLLALWGGSSCELDYFPADAIEQEQAFRTVQDAKAFRNAFYVALRGNYHGENYYATDIQSDLLNATLSYGNEQGELYTWNLYAANYTVGNLWSAPYRGIANVNNFLDHVSLVQPRNDAERRELGRYIAEAHLTRAILYRSLVLRYAKDYEPASAPTDPGVPLVLHYNIAERPARASVAAVYGQILDDMAAARAGLTTEGAPDAKYLTVDCITALEAQVYLEMHRYAEAAAAAGALIDGGRYPLVATGEALAEMWTHDQSTETLFQPVYAERSEAANGMAIYNNYNGIYYAPSYVPQQWVVDLFADTDLRRQVFLRRFEIRIQGTRYPDIWLIDKYPGNPALYEQQSTYVNSPKVFRIAEMYLIKAEALAWKGDADADARSALNALRERRGLMPTGAAGANLKREIQLERTREMLCEGTRLYDLKRWQLPVERHAPQNAALVVAVPPETTVGLRKNAGHNLFVWGIPHNDMMTNPRLTQNPGW